MFRLKTKAWLPVGWSPSVVFEFQHDSIECMPVWLIQIKFSWDESLILNSDAPHSEVSLFGNLGFPQLSDLVFSAGYPMSKNQFQRVTSSDYYASLIYELITLHPALSSRYLRGVQASFVFMTWGLITTSWSSNNQTQCLAFHTLSSRP